MTALANSEAERVSSLDEAARGKWLSSQSQESLWQLEYDWNFWARIDQHPPESDWRVWFVMAGRGLLWQHDRAQRIGFVEQLQEDEHGLRVIAQMDGDAPPVADGAGLSFGYPGAGS